MISPILKEYIESQNRSRDYHAEPLIVTPLDEDDCKVLFISLVSDLSPENIACDGEISREEADQRYNDCMLIWGELEKSYGRVVEDTEAWGWQEGESSNPGL